MARSHVLRLAVDWSPGEPQDISVVVDDRTVLECDAASEAEPHTYVAAGVFAGCAGGRPITLLVDDFSLFAAHG